MSEFTKTGQRAPALFAIALAICLFAGKQVWAQANGSFTIGSSGVYGPVAVSPDRRFVRIGGVFSGTAVNLNRIPTPIVIRPVTANARIRNSVFYGSRGLYGGGPLPIVIYPPVGPNGGYRIRSGIWQFPRAIGR